jgi:hypothetical protein
VIACGCNAPGALTRVCQANGERFVCPMTGHLGVTAWPHTSRSVAACGGRRESGAVGASVHVCPLTKFTRSRKKNTAKAFARVRPPVPLRGVMLRVNLHRKTSESHLRRR